MSKHVHIWNLNHSVPSLLVAYFVCGCGANGKRRRARREKDGTVIPGDDEIVECKAPKKPKDRSATACSIAGRNETGHYLPPSGGSKK